MLLLKLLLVPVLIALSTLVGRRWGPTVGGWFAALPLTSGPVLLVLSLERGAPFAATASVGTVLALVSLSAFAIVYARTAMHANWFVSTALAWATFFCSTWLLQYVALPLIAVFPVGCAALYLGVRTLPAPSARRPGIVIPAWDIPLRMLIAAGLVFGMSRAAQALGPTLSGLLTPMPIAITLLTAFTHRLEGSIAAAGLLRGLLIGLFSFAVFFVVTAMTLASRGIPVAFGLASLAAVAMHAVIWRRFVASTVAPRVLHGPAFQGAAHPEGR